MVRLAPDWPAHRVLSGGHKGPVTCLLYPHEIYPHRYSVVHLLSGGVDFAVCVWELAAGTLLYRFCHQAGKIQRLLVPPDNCNVFYTIFVYKASRVTLILSS